MVKLRRLNESLYFRILRSIEKEPKKFDEIWRDVVAKKSRFGEALASLVKAGCIERLPSGDYVLLSTGHRMLNYYYSRLEMLLIEAQGKGIISPLVRKHENSENRRSRGRGRPCNSKEG